MNASFCSCIFPAQWNFIVTIISTISDDKLIFSNKHQDALFISCSSHTKANNKAIIVAHAHIISLLSNLAEGLHGLML